MTHIHLDPLGGIAGDMFVAAMLDAWPHLAEQAIAAVRVADLNNDITANHTLYDDDVLTGSKFKVAKRSSDQNHEHTHWSALRKSLEESRLPEGTKKHALGIFSELANAEAQVHGKDIDNVVFHEVGNWDSIADIVAAASLIDAVDASSWSVGSLPLGSGRVKTAHGELPIPAPATCLLLDGFAVHDDGRPGERITPTGAAILRYLSPLPDIGKKSRILHHTGYGFGTRTLKGMPNVLRLLVFEDVNETTPPGEDRIAVLQFEIDDQTGEDLAIALDNIRSETGVIDVAQSSLLGKKGRLMTSVQILAKPDLIDSIAQVCFHQTTTLGIRTRIENRMILHRHEMTSDDGLRVKIAHRPQGETAKTDIDDIVSDGASDEANDRPHNKTGHHERENLRDKAEQEALKAYFGKRN